jgi:hypothetical protein
MSLHDFMSFLKETKIASARLTAPSIVDIFSCVQVQCDSVHMCLCACSMDCTAPNDTGQRFPLDEESCGRNPGNVDMDPEKSYQHMRLLRLQEEGSHENSSDTMDFDEFLEAVAACAVYMGEQDLFFACHFSATLFYIYHSISL